MFFNAFKSSGVSVGSLIRYTEGHGSNEHEVVALIAGINWDQINPTLASRNWSTWSSGGWSGSTGNLPSAQAVTVMVHSSRWSDDTTDKRSSWHRKPEVGSTTTLSFRKFIEHIGFDCFGLSEQNEDQRSELRAQFAEVLSPVSASITSLPDDYLEKYEEIDSALKLYYNWETNYRNKDQKWRHSYESKRWDGIYNSEEEYREPILHYRNMI